MKINEKFPTVLQFIYENCDCKWMALIEVEESKVRVKEKCLEIEKDLFLRCFYYLVSGKYISEIMTGVNSEYCLIALESKGIDYIENSI